MGFTFSLEKFTFNFFSKKKHFLLENKNYCLVQKKVKFALNFFSKKKPFWKIRIIALLKTILSQGLIKKGFTFLLCNFFPKKKLSNFNGFKRISQIWQKSTNTAKLTLEKWFCSEKKTKKHDHLRNETSIMSFFSLSKLQKKTSKK